MAAYIVIDIVVHDTTAYERYKALAPASLEAYGGRYIARGGKTATLEGSWAPQRVVILEFADVEKARAWHASPEYAPARAIRDSCATAQMIVVEGL